MADRHAYCLSIPESTKAFCPVDNRTRLRFDYGRDDTLSLNDQLPPGQPRPEDRKGSNVTRIGLAFRVFFRILSDASLVEPANRLLSGPTAPAKPEPAAAPAPRRRNRQNGPVAAKR